MLARLLCRVLGLLRLDELVQQAENHNPGAATFESVTRTFRFFPSVTEQDRRRIPSEGPVIVASNHPTGGLEGIIVMALLESVRRDVKTMAHVFFSRWPYVARRMFLVDIGDTTESSRENMAMMRQAARWVRQGRMLLCLPSANVARFDWRRRAVADPPWRPGLARLALISKATVLPCHVEAQNSLLFHILAAIHPRIGALVLGRELLAKRFQSYRVRIGRPIPTEEIQAIGDQAEITAFLRREVARLAPAARSETSFEPLNCEE